MPRLATASRRGQGPGNYGILWAQGRMAHEGPGDGQAQGYPACHLLKRGVPLSGTA